MMHGQPSIKTSMLIQKGKVTLCTLLGIMGKMENWLHLFLNSALDVGGLLHATIILLLYRVPCIR
jgi:hypothetical protein